MQKWAKRLWAKNVYNDFLFVFKGIVVIAVILIIGLNGAEKAMNELTRYQKGNCIISFKVVEPGNYQIGLLGKTIKVRQLLNIGKINVEDGRVTLQFNKDSMVFDHFIHFDDSHDIKANGKNQ